MIDPAGLVAFGNMGSGGGLAAVFNPDTATGYAMVSTGWAGLTLSEPTRVKSVSITSASNGFDASGAATSITLRLYGKTGAAPSGPSDGVMLASSTFTDVNAVTTKLLTSADQITLFSHVWISISTGVWAIAQYVQFEEATEATALLPAPDLTTRTTYLSRIGTEINLPWVTVEIPQTRWKPLYIPASCNALVDLNCDFRHRNVSGYAGPIGIGWTFGSRYGASLESMIAASWQPLVKAQTQIASIEHHYAPCCASGAITLGQGYHQFSFSGSAHTTANAFDGNACLLVESGVGYNSARLIVSTDPVNRV